MAILFFQAEDGIRDFGVTGVQTCALPISPSEPLVEQAEALVPRGRGPDGLLQVVAVAAQQVADRHVEVAQLAGRDAQERDRKSVVQGKSVDLGGRRIIKKKNTVRDSATRP